VAFFKEKSNYLDFLDILMPGHDSTPDKWTSAISIKAAVSYGVACIHSVYMAVNLWVAASVV
jgi:hypothetical protein